MDNLLKVLTDKTRSTLHHATNSIKDKLDILLQKPTLSVEELASYIATHPHTQHERKNYLGIQLNFYQLMVENLVFYLETKGTSGEYILKLSIHSNQEQLFEYNSYQHKVSPQKPLKLTDSINNLIGN